MSDVLGDDPSTRAVESGAELPAVEVSDADAQASPDGNAAADLTGESAGEDSVEEHDDLEPGTEAGVDAGVSEVIALAASIEVLVDEVAQLREQQTSYGERAKHRELVIDRLHEENQQLKSGAQRQMLDPVVTGLIRLHRLISREVERVQAMGDDVTTSADLLSGFVSEVELLLDACGIEPVDPEVGDAITGRAHRVVDIAVTHDLDLNRTVAAVISRGFVDRHTGRARAPAEVIARRWIPPEDTQAAATADEPIVEHTEPPDQAGEPEGDIYQGGNG